MRRYNPVVYDARSELKVVIQCVVIGNYLPRRVPGLPIRDCAGSSNNLAQMCPKLSAIHVTQKTFFERLYLVAGLSPFEPRVNCPYAPTLLLFT